MRSYTKQLLQMISDGLLSESDVVNMCLNYMSDADVQGMMESNELLNDAEQE